MNKLQMVKFTDNEFELDVRADSENETMWLSVEEMSTLFERDRTVISRHIKNVFNEKELDEKSNVHFLHIPLSDKPVAFYNLDVIISVGYRVKSQRGIVFRKWASNILKEYLIKGYAANEKRLIALNKTIDIQTRMLSYALDIDKDELLKVIEGYTRALDLLDDYDHQALAKPKGTVSDYVLTYEEAREIINFMKFNEKSDIFGIEKEEGKLNGIIQQIYQDVFGQQLYPTVEEKAAHLLYFLVKDHPFVDGCKRIAATLFINFLFRNGILQKNNRQIISNEALVALTILTAESNPDEIEIITKLIANLLV
jgi:prophage maintenance system killer protein